MKKNRMMRLASILLVCVLMTTSVISGTFAKYTTSDTGTDSARVAKWGFEATDSSIVLDDLFKSAYNGTVNSTEDVVAPGTENSVKFSFAYDTTDITAPEVDYNFTILAEVSSETSYKALDDNPNFYWTLSGPNELNSQYQTVADLLEAINKLDGQYGTPGKKYEANTLPTTFYGESNQSAAEYEIGWVWAFETKDEVVGADQDALDTAMGNADALDNINITITITATQVD